MKMKENIKNIVHLWYSQASRWLAQEFTKVRLTNTFLVSNHKYNDCHTRSTLPISIGEVDYIIFGWTNDQIWNYAVNLPPLAKEKIITLQNWFNIKELWNKFDIAPQWHIVLTCAIKENNEGEITVTQFMPCPTTWLARNMAQDITERGWSSVLFSQKSEQESLKIAFQKNIVNSIVNTATVAFNDQAHWLPKASLEAMELSKVSEAIRENLKVLGSIDWTYEDYLPTYDEIMTMIENTALWKFADKKPSLWYDFFKRHIAPEQSEYYNLWWHIVQKAHELWLETPTMLELHKKFLQAIEN